MSDVIALFLVGCSVLILVVAVVFFINGIDDLIIDICYLGRVVYKRLFVVPRYRPLQEEDLRGRPEQPLAVMIPAWQESGVIRQMLVNTRGRLDYTNYVLFVGTYPNDPATAREVDGLVAVGARIVRVTVPHDGPTNKADCLNWIYHGIRRYESVHGVEFQIFVMQDCEDVIHPLCYRLFNYLIPRKDMVQLPVLSLERKWQEFTAGHYLDEFAHLHYKDLVVRELIDRSLPAAGVGVAFSRRAIGTAAEGSRGEVFYTNTLTEDYEFGFRLKELGMRQIFVKFEVERGAAPGESSSDGRRTRRHRELVGVREYFPGTLRSAVRQKSRWVLGIVMQGWSRIGWSSDWRTNYMLYRDRKTLVTNLASIGGYVVVLIVLAVWALQWLWPDAYRFPPIVQRGSLVWYLLIANAVILVYRMLERAYCVGRLHGWRQAVLSVPRLPWGNIVNFAATVRAIRLYVRYLITRQAIAWDKTDHTYPATDAIPFRRRLGELLVDLGLISVQQLEAALDVHRRSPIRLGDALVQIGAITAADLESALRTGSAAGPKAGLNIPGTALTAR